MIGPVIPRRLRQILLATLIVLVMVNLARTGLADFIRLRSTMLVDGILNQDRHFTVRDLDGALSQLRLSGRIDPGNPLVPEYEGHVYFLRARLARSLPALRRDFLEQARSDYREALELRPNSPYLWSSLCIVDGRLLGFAQGRERSRLIDELGDALLHAGRLGPWEYAVQHTIASIGGRYLPSLDARQREMVEKAWAHLAYYERHPREQSVWRGPVSPR